MKGFRPLPWVDSMLYLTGLGKDGILHERICVSGRMKSNGSISCDVSLLYHRLQIQYTV